MIVATVVGLWLFIGTLGAAQKWSDCDHSRVHPVLRTGSKIGVLIERWRRAKENAYTWVRLILPGSVDLVDLLASVASLAVYLAYAAWDVGFVGPWYYLGGGERKNGR